MAGVGAPVGKVRPVLTVVAEDGSTRDGVSLLDDVVREGARRMLAGVHAVFAAPLVIWPFMRFSQARRVSVGVW